MNKKTHYFAAKEANELADTLLAKDRKYSESIFNNGYLEKIGRLYSMYHGLSYYDSDDGHKIRFEGEQGELASMNVNHLRNIGKNMLTLVTASRPTMEARAINTDYKSQVQTKLANGLLDYYMREKRLEDKIKLATEYAIALGSGYVRLSWNATSGEQIDFDEELNTPIYEGDVEFDVLSPLDVSFDSSKESYDQNDWVMTRTFKNKFDLIAKYPEFEDQIKGLDTKDSKGYFTHSFYGVNETTDVPVYEFYHNRTESLPEGRYTLFLSPDIVLVDLALPYYRIPIYRITPSVILGTPYGYTPLFDLMPLQEAVNMLYSTILTNQNAFGVQNIIVPRNADIAVEALSGGLNIIEFNPNSAPPSPLNLTQTPKEVFDYLGMLIQAMETVSGINSVVRGNPEANLRSGNAMALLQSNSIQFMSDLAMQYNQLIEDVGTGLLKVLQMYASTKRVAAIVGINNRSYLKEFTGDDLSNISRVIVSAGNPLSRTTAGRAQMATELLQYGNGMIKNPQQYLSILATGTLDSAIDPVIKENNLIQSENEQLLSGIIPPVLDLDSHRTHIVEHKAILSDARMREYPELVQAVMEHIRMHMDSLQYADPMLLQLVGEQSLQPPMQPMGVAPEAAGTLPQQAELVPQSELPNPAQSLPTPPQGFENVPLTPNQLQEQIQR